MDELSSAAPPARGPCWRGGTPGTAKLISGASAPGAERRARRAASTAATKRMAAIFMGGLVNEAENGMDCFDGVSRRADEQTARGGVRKTVT